MIYDYARVPRNGQDSSSLTNSLKEQRCEKIFYRSFSISAPVLSV